MSDKHSHYHKDVSHLKTIDVYRTLELFGVTDQALGHAIKKLMCAGQRGTGKSFEQDVREAVDTLNRRLQMLAEDDNWQPKAPVAAPFDIPAELRPPIPSMQACLVCGEPGGHFGLPCPKSVPRATMDAAPQSKKGVPAPPPPVAPTCIRKGCEAPREIGNFCKEHEPVQVAGPMEENPIRDFPSDGHD